MKLFIVIFFLSKIIYANTVFEPNKVPNIDYLKKLNQVSALELEAYSKNRIFLMYAYDNIKIGERENIKCNKLSSKFNLNKFNIFNNSMQKYNFQFLQKINMNYIIFCENLTINDILTAGIPNPSVSTLILDFVFDDEFFERAIHHEIFHMIQSNYDVDDLNAEWKMQNSTNFTYAGCSTCAKNFDLSLMEENNGFITKYSQASASEDQAEVFSVWMTNKVVFYSAISNDEILKKKINILENFLTKINFFRND